MSVDEQSVMGLSGTPAGRALRAAVNSVLEGADAVAVAASHGLPVGMVRAAVEHYREGGSRALDQRQERPGVAARRKLSHQQEEDLHRTIRTYTPDELGHTHRLWTKDAVRALITQRTGLVLPARTLDTYLERWGFAPEKPLRQLYRRQPALIREWMRKDYPIVALEARERDAQLHWWGHVPLVARDRNRLYANEDARPLWPAGVLSMLHVVTNRGHVHWMVHPGELNGAQLIEFMARLVSMHTQPLLILLQDHPLFASPLFIEWSLRHTDRIGFHLLPMPLLDVPPRTTKP